MGTNNIYMRTKTEWFLKLKEQLDLLVEGKKETDYMYFDGKLIEDWVIKFYINKAEFHGSYN